METPIVDFITSYVDSGTMRLHMPGHKGAVDPRDITEIDGTDELIRRSEENASSIFGFPTFYSAEGSSLMIRAMCNIVTNLMGKRVIVASRNCHQSFISACALLDIDVEWLPFDGKNYLSSDLTAQMVDEVLERTSASCVYLTSPDYLGKIYDIESISSVCHKHGVYLAVDNAHGAYLKFFDRHPMDLGCDICCDSAHKTLPVITGGAYLHMTGELASRVDVSKSIDLFASTSPSWRILESLDMANKIMTDEDFVSGLQRAATSVNDLRRICADLSYGNEPLKLTLLPNKIGLTGFELASTLRNNGIEPEFADNNYVTLMFSPYTTSEDFEKLTKTIEALPHRESLSVDLPEIPLSTRAMSIREASLSVSREIPVEDAEGRIASFTKTSCPPAVPIVIAGEVITSEHIKALKYYGFTTIRVI